MLNFVLCDDNVPILNKFSKQQKNLKRIVIKNKGYTLCNFVNNDLDAKLALSTPNPHDVLDYVKNNQVDVLILDIDFKSNISGIDIANKIRAKNKNVYIIFATGHLEYLILAYKCKTFDYLPKPISLDNLETTILRLFDDVKATCTQKGFINIDIEPTTQSIVLALLLIS